MKKLWLCLVIGILPILPFSGSMFTSHQAYSFNDESAWQAYNSVPLSTALKTVTSARWEGAGRLQPVYDVLGLTLARTVHTPQGLRFFRWLEVGALGALSYGLITLGMELTSWLFPLSFLILWTLLGRHDQFSDVISGSSFMELEGVLFSFLFLLVLHRQTMHRWASGMGGALLLSAIAVLMAFSKETFGPLAIFFLGLTTLSLLKLRLFRALIPVILISMVLTAYVLLLYFHRTGYSGRYQPSTHGLGSALLEGYHYFFWNVRLFRRIFWVALVSIAFRFCRDRNSRLGNVVREKLILGLVLLLSAVIYFAIIFPWAGQNFYSWYYLPFLVWTLTGLLCLTLPLLPLDIPKKLHCIPVLFLLVGVGENVQVWNAHILNVIRLATDRLKLATLVGDQYAKDRLPFTVLTYSPEVPLRIAENYQIQINSGLRPTYDWIELTSENLKTAIRNNPNRLIVEKWLHKEDSELLRVHYSTVLELGECLLALR